VRHNTTLGRYTQFANLLNLAVVTIPNAMTADGRPSSLSLIGPAGSDATLSALAAAIEGVPVRPAGPVRIVVAGRHLRGESRNGELTGRAATFLRAIRTAPLYRLYDLPTGGREGLPGLVRVADGGTAIEVEEWELPIDALGGLLAGVPAPLSLGWVCLADGSSVLGFLCEAYAVGGGSASYAVGGGSASYAVGGGSASYAAAGSASSSGSGSGSGADPATCAVDISASGGWRAYRAASGT
jgi:allophanate hydrolase